MTPRLLIAAAALALAGCSGLSINLPGPDRIAVAAVEAANAKQAADAGSTVGVAAAIRDSTTLSDLTSSAKAPTGTTAGEKVAAGIVTAGKALSDPTTVAVVGAGIQAGATAAGVKDPQSMAVLGQAAAAGVGGLLTLIGAGVGAWLNRKKTTTPAS